jgi:TolB protein
MQSRLGYFTKRRIRAIILCILAASGAALAPAVAAQGPGGGTLVFQTASGGAIYAANPDGSALRYLTSGMDPALSPDGQRVAFTRWDNPQHGALGSLWVIDVDGSGERLVSGNLHQPKAPVWSPDGSQIAVSVQQGGRLQPEPKCSRDLPAEPLLADKDGDYFRVVVKPDGGEVDVKLCYTLLPHPFWRLRVVDVGGGTGRDLPGDLFSYAPAWDPANAWRLVYAGEGGLVNLDLNRGATWALTRDVHDHTPAFSPDGLRIAVAYKQHDHWDIHVMNADGSGRARLTETPLRVLVEQRMNGEPERAWNNAAPVWSPDGRQIAFLTDRTGRWEIWVMQADGGDQHPMFSTALNDRLPLSYYSVDERALSWR